MNHLYINIQRSMKSLENEVAKGDPLKPRLIPQMRYHFINTFTTFATAMITAPGRMLFSQNCLLW